MGASPSFAVAPVWACCRVGQTELIAPVMKVDDATNHFRQFQKEKLSDRLNRRIHFHPCRCAQQMTTLKKQTAVSDFKELPARDSRNAR
jgi:hypothetical protein